MATVDLSTSAAGDINIDETDTITLQDVSTADGNVIVSSGDFEAVDIRIDGGALPENRRQTHVLPAGEYELWMRDSAADGWTPYNDMGLTIGSYGTWYGPPIGTNEIAVEVEVLEDGPVEMQLSWLRGITAEWAEEVSWTLKNRTYVGGIAVEIVDAGTTGNVTLRSTGTITEDGDASTVVTADDLTATAGGAMTLDTTVATADLSTSAAGDIDIAETDSIDLARATTVDGGITVAAGGTLTATLVDLSATDHATNDISLTTTTGASGSGCGR